MLCSSIDKNAVDDMMKKLDIKFDIIVDDGWHLDDAQLSTLRNFFPYLKDDGAYIIEDIQPGSKINTQRHIIRNTIGPYEYFFVGLTNTQFYYPKETYSE